MSDEPPKATVAGVTMSKKLSVAGVAAVMGSLLPLIDKDAPWQAQASIYAVAIVYIIGEAAIDFARAWKGTGTECAGVAIVAAHNKARKAAEAKAEDLSDRLASCNAAYANLEAQSKA